MADLSCQRTVTGNKYVKNYEFDFNFGPPWGHSPVTMTSVIGHLNNLDFEHQYRKWTSCPPAQLFDAPLVNNILPVRKNAGFFLAICCFCCCFCCRRRHSRGVFRR